MILTASSDKDKEKCCEAIILSRVNVDGSCRGLVGRSECPRTHALAPSLASRNTFSGGRLQFPSIRRLRLHYRQPLSKWLISAYQDPAIPARNVLTGNLGSCYSQPEKGPWLYLHCTSSLRLSSERANIRKVFTHILTNSARRPTPVRIPIRSTAHSPNASTNLDAL